MRRRALASLTLVSFLLSIVIGAVWLRSYIQLDMLTRKTADEAHSSEWMLAWSRGRLLGVYKHRGADTQDVPATLTTHPPDWAWTVDHPYVLRSGPSRANHYGFTAMATTTYFPPVPGQQGWTWTKYGFVVPCWVVFTALMVLPAIHWGRAARRRRLTLVPPAEPANAAV